MFETEEIVEIGDLDTLEIIIQDEESDLIVYCLVNKYIPLLAVYDNIYFVVLIDSESLTEMEMLNYVAEGIDLGGMDWFNEHFIISGEVTEIPNDSQVRQEAVYVHGTIIPKDVYEM